MLLRTRSLSPLRRSGEGAHLVENPEAATIGCYREVVAMNDDVAHRGDGHVEFERAATGCRRRRRRRRAVPGRGIEQTFLFGVFFDRVDERSVGECPSPRSSVWTAVICVR